MQIRFTINFNYDTFYQQYKANLRLFLPAIEQDLVPQLLNRDTELLGEILFIHWGHRSENTEERFKELTLYNKDLNELIRKTDEIETNIIQIIQQVKEQNERKAKFCPNDIERVYEI